MNCTIVINKLIYYSVNELHMLIISVWNYSSTSCIYTLSYWLINAQYYNVVFTFFYELSFISLLHSYNSHKMQNKFIFVSFLWKWRFIEIKNWPMSDHYWQPERTGWLSLPSMALLRSEHPQNLIKSNRTQDFHSCARTLNL